ncbi:MAG: hypothetical protein L0216_07880 [Planctomycetales bacterium]|nr:hypothetical protein [Planctomycetales bacterium]
MLRALLVAATLGLCASQAALAQEDEGVSEWEIPAPGGRAARPSPGSQAAPEDESDVAVSRKRRTRPSPWLPWTVALEAEATFVWRVTGQIVDLHLNKGDGIDLTKDLDVDRHAVRGAFTFETRFGDSEHPARVGGSFLEFDMRGSTRLPRQNVYALTVLPEGEMTRTWIVLARTTLEGAIGLYGYGRGDTKDWTMDLVAGGVFWGAEWAIETENFGTLNARMGDLRLYAGLEWHKRLSKWLTVHLRGVLGNPSTILGGYGAALEAQSGPYRARVEAHVGTPEFGHLGARFDYEISKSFRVGLVYRQIFEQVMDGGSFFGVSNEGFTRLNHTVLGLAITIRA